MLPGSISRAKAFPREDLSLGDEAESEFAPPLSFAIRCASARGLFNAASALYNHQKGQLVTLAVNSKGLRLIVDNQSKSLHAVAVLPSDMFEEFSLPLVRGEHTEVAFRLSMWVLLECLVIYGASSIATAQLTMMYNSAESGDLSLMLFEEGVLTEASLKTTDLTSLDSEGDMSSLEVAFQRNPRPVRVVLKSEALHDVIKDVSDAPGGSSVVLSMDPQGGDGCMRLHTVTPGGSLTVEVPSKSLAVVSMNIKEAVSFSYHTKLLESSLRALSGSFQTLLRVNTVGVLSVTHRLDTSSSGSGGGGSGVGAWVTTLILPEESVAEEGWEGNEPQNGMKPRTVYEEIFGHSESEDEDGGEKEGGKVWGASKLKSKELKKKARIHPLDED